MFYDQGAGIPMTLPRSHFFELIREFLDLWTDSMKIGAAMAVGRSSTGSIERGKGLQNLMEFARAHDEGRLSIYSLRGMYRLLVRRSGDDRRLVEETVRRDHTNSINGTLIEWEVTL